MGDGPELRMDAAGWGLLAVLALLWAGSFFFFKVLVAALPPFSIVFGRVLIAAAVLNLAVMLRGARMPGGTRLWAGFAALGLLNNVVPYSLIVYGETEVSSGVASILNATTPLFTVIAAQLFTADEKLDGRKLAGLGLGFCGVAVLVGPSAMEGLRPGDAAGELAVLGAAASYGVAGVFGRRFRALPPLTVACAQLTASAALAMPLFVAVDRPWTLAMPGGGAWAALLGLSLLSTALAYILFFRILARAGATAASLVTLLVPAGAVLLGWLALDERLAPSAWAGMALIGLGLACLDGRVLDRMRARRRTG